MLWRNVETKSRIVNSESPSVFAVEKSWASRASIDAPVARDFGYYRSNGDASRGLKGCRRLGTGIPRNSRWAQASVNGGFGCLKIKEN